jgi:hypothetical protein
MHRATAIDLVAALSDPRAYPHRADTVEHRQTHISHVFLTGSRVYKLKKPVRFPFLDFHTPERRHHYCQEEVRLNRRLCPSLYLGVLPVTVEEDGMVRVGGTGAVVDHVVVMQRLPEEGMLSARLDGGRVSSWMIDDLATTLARFHARAPADPQAARHGEPAALLARWVENLRGVTASAGNLVAPVDLEILADFGPGFITEHAALLRARQRDGRIREGHGDLHAANICIVEAPPTRRCKTSPVRSGIYVFDCIEFSEALRCVDVASEIAFAAMDFAYHDRPDLASRFVAAYVEATGDHAIPRLLPFYACAHACVRGKVEALRAEALEATDPQRERALGRCRAYLALAGHYAWRARGPVVIACGGVSGAGKSTAASMLAAATGFEVVSSDRIRKRDPHGLAAAPAPYGTGAYSARARGEVYAALVDGVGAALAAGEGVIADATFLRRADRHRLAAAAREHGAPCVFVECRAEPDVIRERMQARAQAPGLSDARWDTYVAQTRARDPLGPGEDWIAMETGAAPLETRERLLRAVWRWRRASSAVESGRHDGPGDHATSTEDRG